MLISVLNIIPFEIIKQIAIYKMIDEYSSVEKFVVSANIFAISISYVFFVCFFLDTDSKIYFSRENDSRNVLD